METILKYYNMGTILKYYNMETILKYYNMEAILKPTITIVERGKTDINSLVWIVDISLT